MASTAAEGRRVECGRVWSEEGAASAGERDTGFRTHPAGSDVSTSSSRTTRYGSRESDASIGTTSTSTSTGTNTSNSNSNSGTQPQALGRAPRPSLYTEFLFPASPSPGLRSPYASRRSRIGRTSSLEPSFAPSFLHGTAAQGDILEEASSEGSSLPCPAPPARGHSLEMKCHPALSHRVSEREREKESLSQKELVAERLSSPQSLLPRSSGRSQPGSLPSAGLEPTGQRSSPIHGSEQHDNASWPERKPRPARNSRAECTDKQHRPPTVLHPLTPRLTSLPQNASSLDLSACSSSSFGEEGKRSPLERRVSSPAGAFLEEEDCSGYTNFTFLPIETIEETSSGGERGLSHRPRQSNHGQCIPGQPSQGQFSQGQPMQTGRAQIEAAIPVASPFYASQQKRGLRGKIRLGIQRTTSADPRFLAALEVPAGGHTHSPGGNSSLEAPRTTSADPHILAALEVPRAGAAMGPEEERTLHAKGGAGTEIEAGQLSGDDGQLSGEAGQLSGGVGQQLVGGYGDVKMGQGRRPPGAFGEHVVGRVRSQPHLSGLTKSPGSGALGLQWDSTRVHGDYKGHQVAGLEAQPKEQGRILRTTSMEFLLPRKLPGRQGLMSFNMHVGEDSDCMLDLTSDVTAQGEGSCYDSEERCVPLGPWDSGEVAAGPKNGAGVMHRCRSQQLLQQQQRQGLETLQPGVQAGSQLASSLPGSGTPCQAGALPGSAEDFLWPPPRRLVRSDATGERMKPMRAQMGTIRGNQGPEGVHMGAIRGNQRPEAGAGKPHRFPRRGLSLTPPHFDSLSRGSLQGGGRERVQGLSTVAVPLGGSPGGGGSPLGGSPLGGSPLGSPLTPVMVQCLSPRVDLGRTRKKAVLGGHGREEPARMGFQCPVGLAVDSGDSHRGVGGPGDFGRSQEGFWQEASPGSVREERPAHLLTLSEGKTGLAREGSFQGPGQSESAACRGCGAPVAEGGGPHCVECGQLLGASLTKSLEAKVSACASGKTAATQARGGKTTHVEPLQAACQGQFKYQPGTIQTGTGVPRGRRQNLREHVLGQVYEDVCERFVVARQEIGSGQFGSIHKCVDRATGKQFACKTVQKTVIRDPRDAADLRQEVSCLRRLKGHPSIISLEYAAEDSKCIHLVTELCKGGDLFNRIKVVGPVPEALAVGIAASLTEAIMACHQAGIIHRDIKPENVLLCDKDPQCNRIKLIDFGVAAAYRPGLILDEVIGTPYYMAPEVYCRRYGPECDFWSLGVVLYVALSGLPPFWAKNGSDVSHDIINGKLSFDHAKWEGVSEACKDLISRMLVKDPTGRITGEEILGHPWICGNAP